MIIEEHYKIIRIEVGGQYSFSITSPGKTEVIIFIQGKLNVL